MIPLNFNHLYYFWVAAREGSITAASKELRVAQPTVSAQIKLLEQALGSPLFERGGRGLTLTSAGQIAFRHAEEMFRLSGDMSRALSLRETEGPPPLAVGTSDSVPKLVIRSVLTPLIDAGLVGTVVSREWRPDQLLLELSLHRLDLVFADTPAIIATRRRTTSFKVGSSAMVFAGAPAVAEKYRRGFPDSLSGAPVVLPADGTWLRDALDRWLKQQKVTPRVVLEAEDRSLLHHFAQSGHGLVPVAQAFEKETYAQFSLVRVGVISGVKEVYHALVTDRSNPHPAIEALLAKAEA